MIHITHARIVSDVPTFGVALNIRIPDAQLNHARQLIAEQYQATQVHLTYEHYDTVRHLP